jgi:hypothetical protein
VGGYEAVKSGSPFLLMICVVAMISPHTGQYICYNFCFFFIIFDCMSQEAGKSVWLFLMKGGFYDMQDMWSG